ncbi:hypothetical protein UFOVP1329_27 [uncultured Caudovirales phage]|uniref:Uncharacterized protein n=1 Tax=uncultured Caudovirales phage TaxID=2100421 RepID=A0A6J5SSB0_9CAUD|nr:hypothetical protein UFOVP1150_8 [uncultured Caudovirales phage]CAB4199186.1 hypothetical protein UFOVP1329_27 [uncultured Caudovirales phage]CAB4218313.1 hypothetical protein UFOVP1595_9 [uncultured Caudovirales phage]
MKTINNWKPVITSLVRHLKQDGFILSTVDDSEETILCRTDGTGIDAINSVDESSAYFAHAGEERKLWAFIVLGNEPCELVADYTARDSDVGRKFDASITAWSDSWEGKSCPTKEVAR